MEVDYKKLKEYFESECDLRYLFLYRTRQGG